MTASNRLEDQFVIANGRRSWRLIASAFLNASSMRN